MLKQFSSMLLLKWVRLVRRAAPAVLLAVFALAFFAVRYTVDNIAVNTDTEDMLSAQLAWRQLDQEYERLFPQYDNNILIVLEAATPDQAGDAAMLLYERLQAERDLFEFVYYPNALPVFRESGLLYLEPAQLQDLSDNLAEVQPFLARLARDPTLQGLFGALGEALEAAGDGEQVQLEPIFTRINTALEALQDGRPYRLSWQQLMSGDADDAGTAPYREFILTQPKLDYAGFFPATPAVDMIRAAYDELGIAASPGAGLRLTGATMLAHEEMVSVMQGTETAIFLALCLVTFIMVTGLSSFMLALVSVISLVTGLIFTAAFAILTVGELNLISVAFAVLYIGLGVDFAIHYCLRYREHLLDGTDRARALDETSVNIGDSLFLCAVSTAIGFFAFIPTDFTGVAELGWISGVGMFVSFVVTLTVIPALLSLLPYNAGAHRATLGGAHLVEQHAGKILGVSVCVVLVSAAALGGLRFDHNPLNLHPQDGGALTAYRELLADNDLTPWTAIMIAGDDEADRYRDAFTQSELVDKVVTVADFIPVDQDEKLFIIDEMGLLLGDLVVAAPDPAAQTGGARLTALLGFQETLQQAGVNDPVHTRLQANLAALLQAQTGSVREPQDSTGQKPGISHPDAAQLAQLEQMLLASLPRAAGGIECISGRRFHLPGNPTGCAQTSLGQRRRQASHRNLPAARHARQPGAAGIRARNSVHITRSHRTTGHQPGSQRCGILSVPSGLFVRVHCHHDHAVSTAGAQKRRVSGAGPPAHCGADHRRHQRAGRLAAELRQRHRPAPATGHRRGQRHPYHPQVPYRPAGREKYPGHQFRACSRRQLADHHGRGRQPRAVAPRRHGQYGHTAHPGHRRHPGLHAAGAAGAADRSWKTAGLI